MITYWIGPWLAVTFADRLLRRGQSDGYLAGLLQDTTYRVWAGPLAMAAGTGLGVWLFSNQTEYIGVVPRHVPGIGDLAFAAGFVIAGALYVALLRVPGLGPAHEVVTATAATEAG